LTDISIIIVSWNVADLLKKCLDSIAANRGNLTLQTIVVDSASSDETVAQIRDSYPWVELYPQTENIGFVRGNNIGLEQTTGRHILLLNPDTEIIGDMLLQMVAYLDENPDVGIVGPHTLNPDGSTQPSKRRFPTPKIAFFESTWLQSVASQTLLDHYYAIDISDKSTVDVDWVQGHALMVRREVYDQIGGLDEGFVMFFEELDWCKRAKSTRWRVVYMGTAQVIHYGGQSSAQAGAYTYIQFNRSKVHYFRKHHGALLATMLRLFLLSMFLWQGAIETVKWIIRHKPEVRRHRIVTYWQVIRSGL
jgi:N-acetylglucosaminyl-diphospho-decaprenol L-rhamnosyltransferase